MKKILAILLSLTLLLSLTACGNTASAAASVSGADPSAKSGSPAGSYKLTGQTGGQGEQMDVIVRIVDLGADLYLTLKEDGTGTVNLLEAEIPVEWDDDDILVHPPKGSGLKDPVRIPYTCKDDSLKISTSEYALQFNRLTEKELAEYKANGAGSLKSGISRIVQKLAGGLEGDLTDILLFALMQGGMSNETPPIPAGEPSKDSVTGNVDKMKFTVLGAEQLQNEEGPIIVFYYDVTNMSDEFQEIWYYDFDASQKDEFLEDVWEHDSVPEAFNVNLGIAPGRTLRGASMYKYDPDGGVVGFRISCDDDKDSTVLYYADPGKLSGAPAEPFVFDADPSVPEYARELPEETKDVRMENTEFFTDEDGDPAVRFYFTFRNNSENGDAAFIDEHARYALQDGFELVERFTGDSCEEESNIGKEIRQGEEILCAESFKLRTGSPVAFVLVEETEKGDIPFAGKVVEVENPGPQVTQDTP